jgi:chromosome segregation ATPase
LITQMTDETETLRGLLKTRTMDLEVLRSESVAADTKHTEESKANAAQFAAELEGKSKELAMLREKTERDISRLKQSVEAVSSGRGRLEQLAELQTRLDESEAAWAEEKGQLEAQIGSLSAENEALAESNQSLITALESGGGSECPLNKAK